MDASAVMDLDVKPDVSSLTALKPKPDAAIQGTGIALPTGTLPPAFEELFGSVGKCFVNFISESQPDGEGELFFVALLYDIW